MLFMTKLYLNFVVLPSIICYTILTLKRRRLTTHSCIQHLQWCTAVSTSQNYNSVFKSNCSSGGSINCIFCLLPFSWDSHSLLLCSSLGKNQFSHLHYYVLLFINHIHNAFELHSNQNCELAQKMQQPCHFVSAASLLFQYYPDLQQ